METEPLHGRFDSVAWRNESGGHVLSDLVNLALQFLFLDVAIVARDQSWSLALTIERSNFK